MRYNGYIIERNYGHYEIYEGDRMVATADTVAEAKEECDKHDSEECRMEVI